MGFQDPDTGLWVCKKHDWEAPAECEFCLRDEIVAAAMAFRAACLAAPPAPNLTGEEITPEEAAKRLAEYQLNAACRAYEEVGHGVV